MKAWPQLYSPAVDLLVSIGALRVSLRGESLEARFEIRAMSRVLTPRRPLPPARPPAAHLPAGRSWDWEKFPPWLGSFVLHTLAMIALALIVTHTAPPSQKMLIEWQNPSPLDGDDLDAGGGGEPAAQDAAASDPEWAVDAAKLVEPLPEAIDPVDDPALAFDWTNDSADLVAFNGLPEFADGLGNGVGGAGGGRGRGHGTGIGDGNLPGVARTSMFGLVGEGSTFVYVFDRSQSMNSTFTLTSEGRSVSITPLQAAKAELLNSLEHLGYDNRFQLIFYSDDPLMFTDSYGPNGVFAATDDAKNLARDFIGELRGEGNTHHLSALEMALRSKPNVIFWLTDGEAKDDLSPVEVRRLIKMCRHVKTKVNVIHFAYTPRTNNPLLGLAKATGGENVSISIRGLVKPNW